MDQESDVNGYSPLFSFHSGIRPSVSVSDVFPEDPGLTSVAPAATVYPSPGAPWAHPVPEPPSVVVWGLLPPLQNPTCPPPPSNTDSSHSPCCLLPLPPHRSSDPHNDGTHAAPPPPSSEGKLENISSKDLFCVSESEVKSKSTIDPISVFSSWILLSLSPFNVQRLNRWVTE